ncbi:hypothetical protein [Chryseobacterium indoltheticum]|uniref:hypothetical protein n=1 Tax=Chryseobacterium indoltheticum TaxID=254 RepID=UPI003F49461D
MAAVQLQNLNSLDIVPQVWSKGFELYIDNIYGIQLSTPAAVKDILWTLNSTLLVLNGGVNPYACSDPNREGQFSGTFQTALPTNGPMISDDCSDGAAHQLQSRLQNAILSVRYSISISMHILKKLV